MKRMMMIPLVVFGMSQPLLADTVDERLAAYKAEGAGEFSAESGREAWFKTYITKGKKHSCTSCHSNNARVNGKHARTGKPIKPIAPSVNPERLTETKKIAAHAETYNIHVQPHNCHGPIATAAAVQLDACMTNFIIQELVPFRDQITYDLVHEPLEMQVEDGYMPLPTGPGLGVTLNEELVARCPHIRIE